MTPHATDVIGGLVWSADDGGVWAVWQLQPFAFGPLVPARDKMRAHGAISHMVNNLPGPSLLFSLCEPTPRSVLEGLMLRDPVPPRWGSYVSRILSQLEGRTVYHRTFWLAARLPDGRGSSWKAALDATRGLLPGALFAKRRSWRSDDEVEAALRLVTAIETEAFGPIEHRRATAADIEWMIARTPRRATFGEPANSTWPDREKSPNGRLLALNDAIWYEGGSREDEGRGFRRNYIRVETPEGELGYQTAIVVADLPTEASYPDGLAGWWYTAAGAHLDGDPFPVDWFCFVEPMDAGPAQRFLTRRHRNIVGQHEEYSGEPTGLPDSVHRADRDLRELRATLESSPGTKLLRVGMWFVLAAPDRTVLEARARALTSRYPAGVYGLARPIGGQVALVRAGQPGAARPRALMDYQHYLLPHDLAGGAPYCTSDVGDPAGIPLAVNLSSGLAELVYVDPGYGPRALDRSGSVLATGSPGSGKSYTLKSMTWATVLSGGQVVVVDRSASREYVTLADAVPDAQVVDFRAGNVSLDPLACIADRHQATTVATAFLSILTRVDLLSPIGAGIREEVEKVAEAGGRMADVIEALRQRRDTLDVARIADIYRGMSGAAAVLAPTLAPVDLTAGYVCISVPWLTLPEAGTENPLPEQAFGLSLLYLITAVAQASILSDRGRFGAILLDEAWALTANEHGKALVEQIIRAGRKEYVAAWLASQLPTDYPAEIADQVDIKMVFRQAGKATSDALSMLSLPPTADRIELVERHLSRGRCIFRDVRGRTALIQVLPAIDPTLAKVILTTPGEVGPRPGAEAAA